MGKLVAWGYFTVSKSVGLVLLNAHGFYQSLSKYFKLWNVLLQAIWISMTNFYNNFCGTYFNFLNKLWLQKLFEKIGVGCNDTVFFVCFLVLPSEDCTSSLYIHPHYCCCKHWVFSSEFSCIYQLPNGDYIRMIRIQLW